MLQEVVGSACALTGARYGVIATVDDAGRPQEFVTSGLTPEEHQELVDWPGGPQLFARFHGLTEAVRLTDLHAYVRSLGFAPDLMREKTMAGTPMRHHGAHVGSFFLNGKQGGPEFTREDEEILVLFASQAAAAITNARKHRDEQRARADLEELGQLQAEFLSMVSHELRVPLTSIKGSTAAALGANPRPDPAELHQFLRIIDEQADHMRRLINDVLDAGHIETGTLSIAPEPADLIGLVEQARGTYLSGGGRHPLAIDLTADLPRVLADPQRIVQVLNNLFSNASRHAPETSPIRLDAVRDGGYVAVSVSDEGPGVPSHQLPHLFHKHVRRRGQSRTWDRGRSGGGTGGEGVGLGLVICRGIVEAHGGRIHAESAGTGLGTRFTFTIPVAQEGGEGEAAAGNRALPPSPHRAARTRILVVDDDPQTLRYVREALTTAGFVPILTGDPRELPRLVETKKPSLVLLDLMLPGTDGIKLMERVPELAVLPVIFISGYGRDETIARALGLGAADYIVKPFSPIELTARIHAALRRHGESEPFRLGNLAIHYEQRQVTVAGRSVKLTATEYELLRLLSVNAKRVMTYDMLLRHVWRGAGNAKVVRAIVKKLRRKLGDDAAEPAFIVTERGVGYRMAGPDDS